MTSDREPFVIRNSQFVIHNPYVGPRAFEAADRANFYGRDAEIRQLADLVVAQRAVLLYASSGAGKTSLINAGLIPALQHRRMTALPVARVGGSAPAEATNPFIFNLLSSLADETVALEILLKMSLREGLSPGSPLALDVASGARLLVLDQFEELFTQQASRSAAREDFFAQLQDALEAFPHLGLLLAMREEYLAYLDSFSAMLPDRLRARFRLELLDESAARLALQAPAHAAGVPFDDDAARHLVDDLRRVQVQQLDGSTVSALGPAVEPVQLQVVAYRLWESLPPGAEHIGVDALAGLGDVNRALRDYYAQSVARIAAETGVAERAIREWVARQLITAQGCRHVVARGPESSGGLENAAIERVVGVHLVRAEQRAGTTWYELAHDRLVEPLQADNAEWFAEHLSLLQRQATLWDEQKRPAGLLLSGDALAEAEAWVACYDDDLTPSECDFLNACREAEARARREQQQSRRIRWLALGATLAFVVALLLAFLAWEQMRNAEDAKLTAELRRIEAEDARGTVEAIAVSEREARKAADDALASVISAKSTTEAIALAEQEARKLANEALIEAETQKERAENSLIAVEMEKRRAEESLRLSNARRLALLARTQLSIDPERSVLLAVEAVLITYSQDGTIVFEAEDVLHQAISMVRVEYNLLDYTDTAWKVAFSPNGELVAFAGRNGVFKVWDFISKQEVLSVSAHSDAISSIAFSQDGSQLVTASYDGKIKIYDVLNGNKLIDIDGNAGRLLDVTFNTEGTLIIAADEDKTAKIWDVFSGQELLTLEGHTDWVLGVAISPDGKYIATASRDGTAIIWDAFSGKKLFTLSGHIGQVSDVIFISNGRQLVTTSFDRTAKIWDVTSGQELYTLYGHTNWVQQVATVNSDNNQLATASDDGTVKVWDAISGQSLLTLPGNAGPISSIAFSPHGEHLVTVSQNGIVKIWNISSTYELLKLVGHTGRIWDIAFSPDGKYLATASHDGTVKIWETISSQALLTLSSHVNTVRGVTFSPNGVYIATASGDSTVKIWNAVSGQELLTLRGYPGRVWGVSFSPGAERLATSSFRIVKVWNVPLGQSTLDFTAHNDWIQSVVFSSDGTKLATASDDGTAKVWNAVSGQELLTLSTHTDRVLSVAFSPDGNYLATASADKTVKLWDSNTGMELLTFLGHNDTVSDVEFTPDGQYLVTASWDKTAKVWDLVSGITRITLVNHTDRVLSIAISPDGKHLATAGDDNSVSIYTLDIEELLELACSRVTRNLSQTEWDNYLGKDVVYQKTCANLPMGE